MNGDEARELIENGYHAVAEGANMPTTPEGVDVFQEADCASRLFRSVAGEKTGFQGWHGCLVIGIASGEVALPIELVDIKVCAADNVWSGLKLVIRKALQR